MNKVAKHLLWGKHSTRWREKLLNINISDLCLFAITPDNLAFVLLSGCLLKLTSEWINTWIKLNAFGGEKWYNYDM